MNKYLLLILLTSQALLSHAQTTIVYVNSDWKELKEKLKQAEGTVEDLDPGPFKEQKLTLEEKIKLSEALGQTKRAATLKKQLAIINAKKAEAEVKRQQEEKKKAEAEVKRQQEEKKKAEAKRQQEEEEKSEIEVKHQREEKDSTLFNLTPTIEIDNGFIPLNSP